MRIYSASDEETLRARQLLKDWAGERFLTGAQYQRMQQEAVSEVRTTNIFLRLVLFLFTLIIVGAAAGLFFQVFLSRPSIQTTGIALLIFAPVCYAAAEMAVSQARLYRFGIEEALALCSIGFLSGGIEAAVFSGGPYSPTPHSAEFVVPAAAAILSLWIWRRFGFPYAFLAAMIAVVFVPHYWTSSQSAQHLIVAMFYAAGLASIATVRIRHRFDYLDDGYSLVEAFLWLGIYLAINLQLRNVLAMSWVGVQNAAEFSRPFYWTTFVLIWCLPTLALVRGVLRKDRFVLAAGAIAAILTLVTNKPYLSWQRHTWDPMLLGILLTGAALFIRRWLAGGQGGIRHGFTAERLSGRYQQWMNAGSAMAGLLAPNAITPQPQTSSPEFGFGGGDSGGGGASSDF